MTAHAGTQITTAGSAALRVRNVAGESAVVDLFSQSPSRVLVPRPRGTCVWAYLSNFGGGLVAGDATSLDVDIETAARCYIGSQGYGKVYRNQDLGPSSHITNARIAAGGLLGFMPDPIQPFADSAYTQQQTFHLENDANLVMTDGLTCGRMARKEQWAFSSFSSKNQIFLEGERLLHDSLRIEPRSHRLPFDVGHFTAFVTAVLLGPLLSSISQSILKEIGSRPITSGGETVCSASPLGNGLILRLGGVSTESVLHELHRLMSECGTLFGGNPWARKP